MKSSIKGYNLVNEEKLRRAIYGTPGRDGKETGGVGEGASDEAIIAAYDKLGGLIKNAQGHKVKMGSFYDFKAKAPLKEPNVILLFRNLEGVEVEVPEGDAIPVEVKAAELATKAKKVKKAKKK